MKKFIPVFLVLFLIVPIVAFAAGQDPASIICNILNKIKLIVAALGFGLAVILLIVGGIQYMTSGGETEKATSARKLIINALIGIAIIFAAIFILSMVEGFLTGSGIQILQNNCQIPL
ncbi:hypothetical protein KKA23_03045 [Patescibacteria group bacterium]|nr:hypothetical protein [Patescibacteria group bacterium]MBU2564529.1 hypothetical protein [Patescibacteria group bacterium]